VPILTRVAANLPLALPTSSTVVGSTTTASLTVS